MKQKVEGSKPDVFQQLLQFNNVKVLKAEPDGLRIRHEGGVCKVTFEDLPEDVRRKFEMSDDGARAYREKIRQITLKQAQLKRIHEELKTSKLWVSGEIFQAVPGGALLQYADAETTKKIEKRIPFKVQIDGPTGLYPDQPRRFRTDYRSEWIPERVFLGDLIFVRCESHSLSPGAIFKGDIYPDGNYTYGNILGETRTVAAYETDLSSLSEEKLLRDIVLPESKLEEDSTLTIVKAHYGTSKVFVDVSERARELISNDRLEVHSACPASKTPTWISLTDPVPYKKKHTTITYKIGSGEEKTIWVPEGEKIILPP